MGSLYHILGECYTVVDFVKAEVGGGGRGYDVAQFLGGGTLCHIFSKVGNVAHKEVKKKGEFKKRGRSL